ncbi:MAG: DoxX family protein [Pseudaminobacter sp.]
MSTNSTAAVVKPGVSTSSAVVLVGRVFLSSLFILAGYAKLTGLAGTAGWFGSIGLPLPMLTAIVVGLLELFGGLAILVGFQTRLAAIALAIFTLAATAIAHLDFSDQMQVLLFQKNISITGGLLILAAFGAGALSIDNRR